MPHIISLVFKAYSNLTNQYIHLPLRVSEGAQGGRHVKYSNRQAFGSHQPLQKVIAMCFTHYHQKRVAYCAQS